MYDGVRLRMPNLSDTSDVERRLGNLQRRINADGEITSTVGNLKNMRVVIYPAYIYITGSLSAYLNESNLYPVDRHSTEESVEKLSDELGLSVSDAEVTMLEIGFAFVMDDEPSRYFPVLGDMQGFTRLIDRNTLYYRKPTIKQNMELYFYDKIKDAKAKRLAIPKGMEHLNLLRYELRLKGRIAKTFNMDKVTASTLGARDFYREAVNLWYDYYKRIAKKYDYSLAGNDDMTTNECFMAICGVCLNQNEDKVDMLVEAAKDRLNKMSLSRLRKKIRDAKKMSGIEKKGILLRELDDMVMNASLYV